MTPVLNFMLEITLTSLVAWEHNTSDDETATRLMFGVFQTQVCVYLVRTTGDSVEPWDDFPVLSDTGAVQQHDQGIACARVLPVKSQSKR